jgi:hypothetical protein
MTSLIPGVYTEEPKVLWGLAGIRTRMCLSVHCEALQSRDGNMIDLLPNPPVHRVLFVVRSGPILCGDGLLHWVAMLGRVLGCMACRLLQVLCGFCAGESFGEGNGAAGVRVLGHLLSFLLCKVEGAISHGW